MNQPLTHFVLAALWTVGLMGCATDSPPSSTTERMRPAFQSQSPVIEGQVVRNEGSAYIIRELSGRQTRVAFDRKTVRDNIAVGDTVVARFDGLPSSAYATSIRRGTGNPTPPSTNISPRLQTVEGIVQQQDGNDYVIKENTGRDVRLHADNATRLDRDIRTGDRVMVITSTMTSDASMYSIYKLGNPNVLQGEVVRIDGDGYVIRESGGRNMRLRVDNTTRFDRNITVGDKVVAITNPMPSDAPYVTTMYRLDSPHLVQGEVVWTDENGYVVRDFTGRDVRLQSNSATVRNDNIHVGDRIIADTGSSSSVHVDSIAKR
ncbi:MAG TPA: hypothetical protein VK901_20095 [Nitrospiraceae bacterium]|nr:hypothetical protein [Nitrospiraceae bacterium]